MTRTPGPLFDPDHEAVDLAAVAADDALLDDVGSGRHHKRVDPLVEHLAMLRASVDAQPQPELVDTDMAQAAIRAGRSPEVPGWSSWRWALLTALIAAVGLVLIVVTAR